jgi:hypothetical protein
MAYRAQASLALISPAEIASTSARLRNGDQRTTLGSGSVIVLSPVVGQHEER